METHMSVTKSESIKAFLTARAPADLATLYSLDMEVQVTVAKDGGDRTEGDFKGRMWHGYTDGAQIWKPIRIPRNANTEPEYVDTPMTYDLAEHAEGVGMTGWDWRNRCSRWVAFDFDAVVGHSEKHSRKLSEDELLAIQTCLMEMPTVTIRKSTGGKGLHLYVFLHPEPTANHNEHAAVARAVLSQLSGLAGFDFGSKVDIAGGNMWVWHRKLAGTDGLSVIKAGTQLATAPANWRDYTKVVSGRRAKNLPRFIEEQVPAHQDIESIFEELTGQRLRVPPDAEHRRLMEWLFENYGSCSWWDAEHHMLVTHTSALKEAHTELGLRGKFETNATGTERGHDYNCYAFTIARGAWAVRRYTLGVAEHAFWEQDGAGWTRCFAGETEVLTEGGVFPISELARLGRAKLQVLTPDGLKWIDSEIKSFGEQQIWDLNLRCGETVRTTAQHQWLYTNSRGALNLGDRKATYELKLHDQIPLRFQELPEIDWTGYAHGFVFGDGWLHSRGNHTDVELYGEKVAFFDLLMSHGGRDYVREKYGESIICVRGLPNNWKEIPDFQSSKEYIFGFILGLIGADGCVRSDNGRVVLTNKQLSNLVSIRRLCQFVGLRTHKPWKTGEMYGMTICTSQLMREHFIRRDQYNNFQSFPIDSRTSVLSVVKTGAVEEVFCAFVPQHHNFTLANGVVTGNCLYNREPDLGGAARIYEGIERPEGGFWFSTAETAQKAALLLGADLDLPTWIMGKPTIVKLHKSGRLIVEVEKDPNCPQLPGWLVKGKKFERLFNIRSAGPTESDAFKLDERLRHLVGEDQIDAGWTIKSDGDWHGEPFQHVRVYLQGLGYQPKDVSTIMGSNIEQCWRLVNRPFKDEYPRDRQWNRNAAQLRYKPSLNRDQLTYPSWMRVLRHVGAGLDDAIRAHPWCRASGVLTGADWLKCWIASIFQEPTEPLPYIFLYGPQDSGKSILHEAISLLVTRGVVRADTALTSQSGFNGELENAVLAVVEETNLQKNAVAYARIKDWVTGKQLPVHRKQRQPYTVQNTTHWIQAANSHLACVTSDTWVQTSDGPRRVGDLLNREVVVLHNSQKVRTGGFYHTGHKPVYRITTSRGYSFKATHDHRVLVSYDGYEQWVEVKDLKYGDFLRLHDHRGLSWDGDGNFDDGYVLGHLVGDGTFKDGNRPVLYLCQDFEVLGYLQLALGDARIFERDTGAIIYSDRLTELCEQFGLDSKDINDHIQTGSSQFCEGFLSGLFDTDGWCIPSRKKVGLSQSDYKFLQVVQNMLLRLGITSTIVKVNPGGPAQMPSGSLSDCKPSFALTITMRGNLERFSKRIGFKIQRKSDKLQEALSSWRYSPHNVYFTTEVTDVVFVGTEDVYDVTVPGVESFSGNGFILHNCPVFPGDTRITMILVDSLDPKDMVPKKVFLPMLEKEAPDFVAELLGLELPPSNDRLNVPCIATEDKALAEYANKTFLEVFIEEKCHWAPGHRVKFGELYGRFTEWLDPQHVNMWSSIRVGREIPPKFPKARLISTNEMWVGNISFEAVTNDKFGLRYVVRDGKLVQDELSAVLAKSGSGAAAV